MTAPAKIGRYEIVRRLGKSMTEVYLAIDTVENRKAALKLVKAGSDSATQLVLEAERRGAAIQREMHALDPRVVEIYDYGDADGYFFVAMQYVEGRTLAEVIQEETAIAPNRAAVIAIEICEQLAKFHKWESAVVVHGDIKPSNIHLGPSDTVRLLDFGIAKTLRAGRNATSHDFGSPGYCSPERLVRSEVDQQSDLWAVGATLYEMLAGAPPYRAEDTEKLEALIRAKRPPRALPASVPKPLRLIVAKSLAREAERRYRSATEFMGDLQAFLQRAPTLAEAERRGWMPNATIEAARQALRKATRTVKRANKQWRLASTGAWFLAGMTLWIGGTLAFQGWEKRVRAAAAETAARQRAAQKPDRPTPPPAAPAKEDLSPQYIQEADAIFAAYRQSSDPSLHDFDWLKAEVALGRAIAAGHADAVTLGKQALARGYSALERLSGGGYSDAAAAQLRVEARDAFYEAVTKMPDSPDAHLALARVYVYSMLDLRKAIKELREAERLGARPGPREIEEEADAYRRRAEQVQLSAPREAWQDAQTARALYRKLGGFDKAEEHLKELARIHEPSVRRARWR
jgi:predicted Ser/Thr protein kinase